MSVYETLQQKINSHPIGAPARPEFIEILHLLFTPEEAEMATHLTFAAQPVETISRLSGVSPERVSALCERMARKGLVSSVDRQGVRRYALLPMFPGLFEYPFMLPPQEGIDYERLRKLWMEYYENGLGQEIGGSKVSMLRVLPIQKSIDAKTTVLSFDQVSEYLNRVELFAVGHCPCRRIHRNCDAPSEVCMSFDATAKMTSSSGASRIISKAEAFEVLRLSEEAGLVHCTSNVADKIEILCNCCSCCCIGLGVITRTKGALSRPESSFHSSVVETACNACGICVDRCPVDAITVNGVATVDTARCIGCGLCASTCPTEAMALVRRPGAMEPPPSGRDWAVQVATEKGRLEAFLRNLRPTE